MLQKNSAISLSLWILKVTEDEGSYSELFLSPQLDAAKGGVKAL